MIKFNKRRKGAALLIDAILGAMIIMLLSVSLATITNSQFASIDGSRTALQAQQFAQVKASEIGITSYTNAASLATAKALVAGTGFDREVIVGAEVDLGGGNKQRIITVNIYKTGEATVRFSLPVPLSSLGSVSSGVPSGTITMWSGTVASIPSGWAFCDGTNGTPDMRSRFVYGAGGDTNTKVSWANGWNNVNGHWTPGMAGGEEQHILTIAEMPSHSHGGVTSTDYPDHSHSFYAEYNGGARVSAGGNGSLAAKVTTSGASNRHQHNISSDGGGLGHNIMPRFITLAYIMKL